MPTGQQEKIALSDMETGVAGAALGANGEPGSSLPAIFFIHAGGHVLSPLHDHLRKSAITAHAVFDGPARLFRQETEHVFSGQKLVGGAILPALPWARHLTPSSQQFICFIYRITPCLQCHFKKKFSRPGAAKTDATVVSYVKDMR